MIRFSEITRVRPSCGDFGLMALCGFAELSKRALLRRPTLAILSLLGARMCQQALVQ